MPVRSLRELGYNPDKYYAAESAAAKRFSEDLKEGVEGIASGISSAVGNTVEAKKREEKKQKADAKIIAQAQETREAAKALAEDIESIVKEKSGGQKSFFGQFSVSSAEDFVNKIQPSPGLDADAKDWVAYAQKLSQSYSATLKDVMQNGVDGIPYDPAHYQKTAALWSKMGMDPSEAVQGQRARGAIADFTQKVQTGQFTSPDEARQAAAAAKIEGDKSVQDLISRMVSGQQVGAMEGIGTQRGRTEAAITSGGKLPEAPTATATAYAGAGKGETEDLAKEDTEAGIALKRAQAANLRRSGGKGKSPADILAGQIKEERGRWEKERERFTAANKSVAAMEEKRDSLKGLLNDLKSKDEDVSRNAQLALDYDKKTPLSIRQELAEIEANLGTSKKEARDSNAQMQRINETLVRLKDAEATSRDAATTWEPLEDFLGMTKRQWDTISKAKGGTSAEEKMNTFKLTVPVYENLPLKAKRLVTPGLFELTEYGDEAGEPVNNGLVNLNHPDVKFWMAAQGMTVEEIIEAFSGGKSESEDQTILQLEPILNASGGE